MYVYREADSLKQFVLPENTQKRLNFLQHLRCKGTSERANSEQG